MILTHAFGRHNRPASTPMPTSGQADSTRPPAVRAPHSRFEPDGVTAAPVRSGQRTTRHELQTALACEPLRRAEPLKQPHSEESRSEMDQIVRCLSHDMSAMFMLLEHSFQRLKDAAGPLAAEPIAATEGTAIAVADAKGAAAIAPLAQQFAHVEACLRESKRFLDDLTTVARTGRVHMEPSRVELAAVVEEVLFEQRELLTERNIAVEVAADLPTVWCNACRVKQVVTNLLRNAARHGCDPERPRITIARYPAADSSDPAFEWIAIHDNGRGIPAEFREAIFEPGRRLPEPIPMGRGWGCRLFERSSNTTAAVFSSSRQAAGRSSSLRCPRRSTQPRPATADKVASKSSRPRRF